MLPFLLASISSSFSEVTPSLFTPDPSTVEIAFALDALSGDIAPIAGNLPTPTNQGVTVENDRFVFDGITDRMFWNTQGQRPILSNRDFLLKTTFETTNISSQQGVISDWNDNGNNRSLLIRVNGGNLQLYTSSDGASTEFRGQFPLVNNTLANVELRRVGADLTFTVNSNSGTYNIGTGYTFYEPTDHSTYAFFLGFFNNRRLSGLMDRVSLEYLS